MKRFGIIGNETSAIWGKLLLLLASVIIFHAQSSAQTFRAIQHFSGTSQFSVGRLLVLSNSIYGLAAGNLGYGGIFRVNTNGGSYSVIKNFPATVYDGVSAYTNASGTTLMAGLVSDGNMMFGTASQGGSGGKGTIFALKPDGTGFTVLRHFTGLDGKSPYAELLLVGNILYGTTAAGGISNRGTIFRLNKDGSNFTVLKSLTTAEGMLPLRGLVLSGDTLYGAAYQGGISNNGTIFSLKTNGNNFTVLKDFNGPNEIRPHATLVLAGNTLFGTTDGNGDESRSVIFKLNTDGGGYAVIKSFAPGDPIYGTNSQGSYLREGLVLSGNTLYGATEWGGKFGSGVIFKMSLDGTDYMVLKHFSVTDGSLRNSDGANPLAPLTLSGGGFYGTTQYGGNSGLGTVFTLDIAPRILVKDSNFGFHSGRFGFNLTGYSNQTVVIDAGTNLNAPQWISLQTNTVGSSPVYFGDPTWTNAPVKFYRVRAY